MEYLSRRVRFYASNDWGFFCVFFLLPKIALPYPHRCLVGYMEQNILTDQFSVDNDYYARKDKHRQGVTGLDKNISFKTILVS